MPNHSPLAVPTGSVTMFHSPVTMSFSSAPALLRLDDVVGHSGISEGRQGRRRRVDKGIGTPEAGRLVNQRFGIKNYCTISLLHYLTTPQPASLEFFVKKV